MALTKADPPMILRNHYKECDLSVPENFTRSVAFSTWDRHNAYQSIEDLREDIVENVPNTMFYPLQDTPTHLQMQAVTQAKHGKERTVSLQTSHLT